MLYKVLKAIIFYTSKIIFRTIVIMSALKLHNIFILNIAIAGIVNNRLVTIKYTGKIIR